jgi:DNA polymerase elongation subunit (family B)
MRNNYIAAVRDYDNDRIVVWERTSVGRVEQSYPCPWYFYVPSENGTYRSIFDEPLEKLVFDSEDEFKQHERQERRRYESDIQPLYKVLMNEYYGIVTPTVNFALFDIEVNYSSKLGFSSPANPYAPINAVTIYQSWTKQYLTFVVPPVVNGKKLAITVEELYAEFDALVEKGELRAGQRPSVIKICAHENDLLREFLDSISDADIISGWNSAFFDLPYIVRRLELQLRGHLSRLCFPGCKPPKLRMVNRFGTEEMVYELNGRTHLDYLELFKKFTFEGRTSYSLGNILQEEVGLSKLHYEGTLEQLYHNDFSRFVCYNFRDVSGMVDLDDKFKFIQLVNQMAHDNTCLFKDVLGTVRYVETAVTNRAHNVHNLIVPDKRPMSDNGIVEGALVLTPHIGMHDWLGSVDINSLYPSVIRSLNISPERFVGQFTNGEDDWRGIMINGDDLPHTMQDDHYEELTYTGAEWRVLLEEQKWAVSAYGTVFDQGSGLGIVPDTLAYWFTERKRLQAEKKKWSKTVKELEQQIKNDGPDDQRIAELAHAEKEVEQYDLLQLTKKITLNSLYGALLNESFRFGRKEMGASVTACGRMITTHMMETIHGLLVPDQPMRLEKSTVICNEGRPSHTYEAISDVIIYGDTDSCYFRTMASNKEEAIAVADETARQANETFPAFMRSAFNCQPSYDGLIKAGREVVAIRGLFQAKKKYILRVIDLEGMATDKLKTQGSEIKKADTPKVIQQFLKDLMALLLDGKDYSAIEAFINERRRTLTGINSDVFSLGVSKQTNNLDAFWAAWLRSGKPEAGKVLMGEKAQAIPGHIRAAINYNELVKRFEEGGKLIKSGDKVLIFYLKPNLENIKALAFPSETYEFPTWFTENFTVDRMLTEEKMIDNKLEGIFSALGWEIPTHQGALAKKILRF